MPQRARQKARATFWPRRPQLDSLTNIKKCHRSLLILTFFNLVQIMKSNEKNMFLHFLLRSPVILLFLRYLILPKNTFSMLVPIWDPLGLPKKSIDHFWHPLDAALAPEHASRTASGPSKNRSKQKIELLKKH